MRSRSDLKSTLPLERISSSALMLATRRVVTREVELGDDHVELFLAVGVLLFRSSFAHQHGHVFARVLGQLLGRGDADFAVREESLSAASAGNRARRTVLSGSSVFSAPEGVAAPPGAAGLSPEGVLMNELPQRRRAACRRRGLAGQGGRVDHPHL